MKLKDILEDAAQADRILLELMVKPREHRRDDIFVNAFVTRAHYRRRPRIKRRPRLQVVKSGKVKRIKHEHEHNNKQAASG